jgi:hypothetical protein
MGVTFVLILPQVSTPAVRQCPPVRMFALLLSCVRVPARDTCHPACRRRPDCHVRRASAGQPAGAPVCQHWKQVWPPHLPTPHDALTGAQGLARGRVSPPCTCSSRACALPPCCLSLSCTDVPSIVPGLSADKGCSYPTLLCLQRLGASDGQHARPTLQVSKLRESMMFVPIFFLSSPSQ